MSVITWVALPSERVRGGKIPNDARKVWFVVREELETGLKKVEDGLAGVVPLVVDAVNMRSADKATASREWVLKRKTLGLRRRRFSERECWQATLGKMWTRARRTWSQTR